MSGSGDPPLAAELAAAQARIDQLEAALRGSREVGMAMGIVMERHRLSPDQALLALRQMSSVRAVGLREVAAAIVHRR